MGLISWGVSHYKYPCKSSGKWFNGDLTAKNVFVGMGSFVIFGFIDNAGLFFGGCYLDEVFALLPGSKDANVCAGYGNTYSDALGAFVGTFFGKILNDISGAGPGPMWAEAIGVFFGCLLGIAIPKALVSNT